MNNNSNPPDYLDYPDYSDYIRRASFDSRAETDADEDANYDDDDDRYDRIPQSPQAQRHYGGGYRGDGSGDVRAGTGPAGGVGLGLGLGRGRGGSGGAGIPEEAGSPSAVRLLTSAEEEELTRPYVHCAPKSDVKPFPLSLSSSSSSSSTSTKTHLPSGKSTSMPSVSASVNPVEGMSETNADKDGHHPHVPEPKVKLEDRQLSSSSQGQKQKDLSSSLSLSLPLPLSLSLSPSRLRPLTLKEASSHQKSSASPLASPSASVMPRVSTPQHIKALRAQEEGIETCPTLTLTTTPEPTSTYTHTPQIPVSNPVRSSPSRSSFLPSTEAVPTQSSPPMPLTTTTNLIKRERVTGPRCPSDKPTSGRLPARAQTVKLQRKQKNTAKHVGDPIAAATAAILDALPTIPEGPSERKGSLQKSAMSTSTVPPAATAVAAASSSSSTSSFARLPLHVSSIPSTSRGSSRHHPYPRLAHISGHSHLRLPSSSPRRARMSYQTSVRSLESHRSSIRDPPSMPPPPDPMTAATAVNTSYAPSSYSAGREIAGSPTRRPWTPSHVSSSYSSDFSRPPPSPGTYEPADLNGDPRPGTPSSRYGGSPRRPLPRAPMFARSGPGPGPGHGYQQPAYGHDDMNPVVSIPLDSDSRMDDVFGPATGMGTEAGYESVMTGTDLGEPRNTYTSHSQDTLSEDPWFSAPGHAHAPSSLAGGRGGSPAKSEHYGPAPEEGKQERRGIRPPQMSKKEVQLINGELVLECKIPTILYSFLPRRDEIEFTHMRYTAVTCDPDDFVPRGYKLRQNIGRTVRETELFICVTMYNEDEIGFTRTMHAVMKNISHFCSRSRSRTWGEVGWQKIVVCIVSDGREKIHPRTLDALAAMGVYQHGIAKNHVNSKAVQAHVYEYTTQVSLDADLRFKGAEKGIVPCQIIFCLKEKNQRKLNSHRWCFNAFGRALNPNVCILLDVGTRPGSNSLYHLWKAFDTDSNVAGACGEIKAMKGRLGSNLLNPLVASQNFEYKISNILDKPLESVFGYITVLPGALSAYRYHALQNDETGHGPLSQYFKGETLHGQHADVFTANMYLAEDRILCWELVAKRDERWVLKYVKGCHGETDVPDTVPEFVSQRRRWLNGAFFAAVYSLVHFRQVWATDHTFARRVLLHIEFAYQFLQLMFTYFSLANFYLTFYFIAGGLADERVDPFGHRIGLYIFTILRYTCVLLICTQFILSLGNRPQGAKRLYLTSMVLYSIIMVYTTFACIYVVAKQLAEATAGPDSESAIRMGNNVFTNVVVSTASTLGLYFLMSLLYLDPWHMVTSFLQYYLLLPSYICTLQVYAFCNTHDVTWGTKGDNVSRTDLGGAVGKGTTVELEMPSEQLDIDSGYDEALRNLRDRVEVLEPPPSDAQMQEDYYKSVRTYMVVTWMIANAILAMAASEAYGQSSMGDNFYLRFILWSVASLALFRALGSTTFAIINAVNTVVEGRVKMSLKVPRWVRGGWGEKISDAMSGIGSSLKSSVR